MEIYLGLGSNLGDRRAQLARAIGALSERGIETLELSPIVESPALLPDDAPPDWNRPFLNLAARCRTDLSPEQVLDRIKELEAQAGRDATLRWSPRPIDVDILLWGGDEIRTDRLTVPHPALTRRNFVLAPLVALDPRLTIPGHGDVTVLDWSRRLEHRIPLWMGIVNVTPDSFSDGGNLASWNEIETHVDAMLEAGVQIIDIGAESTRPGAAPLSAAEEWARLEPVLEALQEKLAASPLPPLVSVDTYHAEVARRALELGIDIVNDVGGLSSAAMIELAAASDKDWIAMHSLTVPAERAVTLQTGVDTFDQLREWLDSRLERWTAAGIGLDRIIFDPGIGFGKNPLQSLELLRNASRFQTFGLRSLVGHSRKSFMKSFTTQDNADKDLFTIGASLNLCGQGVDIIRVHNVPAHIAAYRGWAHLLPP